MPTEPKSDEKFTESLQEQKTVDIDTSGPGAEVKCLRKKTSPS